MIMCTELPLSLTPNFSWVIAVHCTLLNRFSGFAVSVSSASSCSKSVFIRVHPWLNSLA